MTGNLFYYFCFQIFYSQEFSCIWLCLRQLLLLTEYMMKHNNSSSNVKSLPRQFITMYTFTRTFPSPISLRLSILKLLPSNKTTYGIAHASYHLRMYTDRTRNGYITPPCTSIDAYLSMNTVNLYC